MKTNSRRIAIVQMKSSTDKRVNLRRSLQFIKEAQTRGAKMVVFPEFLMAFSPASQSPNQLAKIAEPIDGRFVRALCESALENRVYVLATIYERCDYGDHVYDTAVLIGPAGQVLGSYQKVHLYDALNFRESEKLAAGNRILPPIETEVGRVGIMICYDIRFPEHARLLALDGADILLVPSGWVFGPMKEEHWFALLRTRAIENGVYVLAAAQTGNIYTGRSTLIDPFGVVLNDLGGRERLTITEIDLERIKEVRRSLPLLDHRREDTYLQYSPSSTR